MLYLWDLSASGYGNEFYAAAAQAGADNWTAFFYGSLDIGNQITVDKPPASIWLMALSVKLFGLNSWSVLVPQALLGVASVGVLYATVKRTSGHTAGLIAGAILALTPAAALMFRFNNPDALLVFLLVLASWFTVRAVEKGSWKWLAWAGVAIGFASLTKMLQAFVILPVLVAVYATAAPIRFRTRVWHLLGAAAAVVVSLGWWVAVVELVPESWRPYIGGSQTNSVLELIFGYNGLGRITGNQVGSVTGGGGGGAGGMWGETGITRMFDGVSGGMISWLIPAALMLSVMALVLLARTGRTSMERAQVILWAGWLVVTALDEIRSAVSRRRPDPALNGASGRLLGQLLRFGGIGIASTAAYALLFWILAGPLGALYANVVALVVTAVANTAANRLLTFGIRGRDRLFGDHVGGLLAFGIGLILTTGSLWLMGTYWPDAARSVTLLVLCLANAVATVIRFVTLRFLFDHRAPGAPEPGTG